jgi:signal transduction histidine kinase/AmiR/NasT family two-component response regulator
MFKTWFNERFWTVTAGDRAQWRIRAAVTLAVGLLLAFAADWRPTLAWLVGVAALEAPLWRLTSDVAPAAPTRLQAALTLVLQTLLIAAWSFAGVILWSGGGPVGQVAAMAFFAALLFHIISWRSGSPALMASAVPAFIAPLLAPLLVPPGALPDQVVVMLVAALAVGHAGLLFAMRLVDAMRTAPAAAAPAPAPRPRAPLADGELSLEALAEAKAEAEAANKAKSAFLAIMSHEIRTPLNGMLGMTQALARDPSLNSSQRQRLAVIRQSGESLLSILNDILDLSKVEAGKLELEHIEFDLAELARGAHESFTALAAQKGLKCKLAIDSGAQGVYLGDPTRVRQILYNLISNALKFTEDGEIGVAIAPVDGGLRMTVTDTGVGIAAEQLDRLFQKFEQADASSTRRYGGTGLGLSICRDLCGLMGGEIAAESEPGRGTRFIVTLPLQKVAAAAAGQAAAAGAPRAAETEAMDAITLRVLAAEDNPTNQLVLKALLGPIGVDPTVVDDGAQAVQAWSIGEFDLILMDIQMPRMDGLSATRAIRAEEVRSGRARTPIIALTANAMAHQVEEYFAAGMDGHVPKPIDLATLYAALEAVQARRKETAHAPAQASSGRS